MKTLWLLTWIIFLGFKLAAQTTISGIITDVNGQNLVGANVYLLGTYDGASTNGDGRFQLLSNEVGSHTLCVAYIGFETFQLEVYLDGLPMNFPDIQLKEEFNELNAVTISAGTFEAGDKKKSISFTSLDMVTTAGASGNVYGALQALPGTTTVGESGKLFVKGGDSRESKTYIDGTLVYVPYHSSSPNNAVRGRFNPFMFSGTMFSTGGYSAEYGQALSSVLALQTSAMPVQDQLNISLLSVGAELGGTKTWEKASLTTSLAYNNLKPYMSLVPQYRVWKKEPQSLRGDLSFRLKTGKSGMLKIYATANHSQLTTLERNLNSSDLRYNYKLINDNYFANASWIGELKKDWILSSGFSYTCDKNNVNVDSLKYIEQLKGIHAKVAVKHRINAYVKIKTGMELYSKKYGIEFPSADYLKSGQFLNNTLAGFFEGEVYTSAKFITRAGLRLEYSDHLKKANIAPRISSAYKWNERSQVSVSYGWFFQDPEDELMLYTNTFKYERADHYTLNYIMKADRRALRTEIYYKDYKDLVTYQIKGNNDYDFLNNEGSGYAYGMDLFWRDNKSIKNAEYWISYSLIDAKRIYRNYPELAVPSFSSKHNLKLVYKHWINRLRSQIGGTYRLSSPRFYNNPNTTQFNGEKTFPYQSLDINWSYLHKQHVIFYFSVSNVLGFVQEFGHEYASLPDHNGVYNSAPILPGAKRFFLAGCFITLSRSGDINQLNKIN